LGVSQGSSVALSADGNIAIEGGPFDNVQVAGNPADGAAWVFTRRNGVWTQQGSKLVGTGFVGTGGNGGAEQGWSVALSGEGTAIVGGPDDNDNTGAAWVFVQPGLQVNSTSNIVAVGNPGGPFAPSSFQYQLSATTGSINYLISGFPNWLTPSLTSGTASSGTTVTFSVNATANTLSVGTYTATITFANSDTGQGTQTRTATLSVQPPALLVAPTTGITTSGTHGGPFSPSSFQYMLSANYGSAGYSIINLPSWLTVSPSSGTVTTSMTTITFRLNSTSADKLTPNTYVSNINFNNTSTGQGNTSQVATLTVNPKPYKLTLDASPPADGTVSGGGQIAEGSSTTVTATPKSGRTLVDWTENGKLVSTSSSYMFTMPSANVTLVAHFKWDTSKSEATERAQCSDTSI
jgi:hypothetical protein